MKIIVLGLRGLPKVQGGVETHAEHLYPIIASKGNKVEIIVRKHYQPIDYLPTWNGLSLTPIWSPTMPGVEALVHSFLAICYAMVRRPDIVHIHAIGPSIVTPCARMLGISVVMTHHGSDYNRQKWGWFARRVLRLGEYLGVKYSNRVIAISEGIKAFIKDKYNRDSELIPNGVELKDKAIPDKKVLKEIGVIENRYILNVSRIVPEKRHGDLIEAFKLANLNGWKLVIVGEIDKGDAYTRTVLQQASSFENVVFAGFRTGESLQVIYENAGMFVLPSSHEGLPIALLEAMSYGRNVIASDIPANLEIGLSARHYFPLGDIGKLAESVKTYSNEITANTFNDQMRKIVEEKYNWNIIAGQTVDVYKKAM